MVSCSCLRTSWLRFPCSREPSFRSLPSVFPLALPPNPHVLIFPGISELTLRLCKGPRGASRSSWLFLRVSGSKTSVLSTRFSLFPFTSIGRFMLLFVDKHDTDFISYGTVCAPVTGVSY